MTEGKLKGTAGPCVKPEGILSAKGYYKGAIDARFGNQVRQAVQDFQKSEGLEADGIVGRRTWGRLFL